MPVYVSGAVEGIVDEAVFGRLVRLAKAEIGSVHRTEGKARLLARLNGFNSAARHHPWLVLIDLDSDARCAPPFRRGHLPAPSRHMAFRVAVRAVEAWLLADRERVSRWLDVPPHLLPSRPDDEPDPKETLVRLARRSRSKSMRADLVPRAGSGRRVGPLYASRLIEFVNDDRRGWRPTAAAQGSDSLNRCLRHLRRLVRPVRARPTR